MLKIEERPSEEHEQRIDMLLRAASDYGYEARNAGDIEKKDKYLRGQIYTVEQSRREVEE